MTVHLTPSHVHLISINNTGRRLWQQSIQLTRFGQRWKTLNTLDYAGCEIRGTMAKITLAVFFYFILNSLLLFFSFIPVRPTRTAVPALSCQRGDRPSATKKVRRLKANVLTSTPADPGRARHACAAG